jgi:hypothetical protein
VHGARPWVLLPVDGVGQHRVDVREVAEHRASRVAAQPRDEVRPLGRLVGGVQLAFEPGILEVGLQPLLARALVAGRVDRVELDEAGEDVGRLGLEIHPGNGSPCLVRGMTDPC